MYGTYVNSLVFYDGVVFASFDFVFCLLLLRYFCKRTMFVCLQGPYFKLSLIWFFLLYNLWIINIICCK